MLTVDDILDERGRGNVRQERLRRFQHKAVEFLRSHFAPALVARTDDELMELAGSVVPAAERRGYSRESELLSYLIPVALLGHRFETDPQYWDMLVEAGWIAADGSFPQQPNSQLLLVLIDEHLDAVRSDDADLEGRADAFGLLYSQNPEFVDATVIMRWLAYLWPARAAWTGEKGLQMLALSLHRTMPTLDLQPVDFLAFCGLAFRFGHGCIDDPQYRWLSDAISQFGDGAEAGREALGNAIIDEITARQNGVSA